MKNSDKRIELLYRSVSRPKPLWSESALYGGYQYFELMPGIWCSRRYEWLMQIILNEPQSSPLFSYALNRLRDKDIQFRPSPLQLLDSCKLKLILSRNPVFAVQGYSLSLKLFLSTSTYTKVYSDVDYALSGIERLSTEELCQNSSHMLTLVNYQSYFLKEHIHNWGNVIIYDSFMFENETASLVGGELNGAAPNRAIEQIK